MKSFDKSCHFLLVCLLALFHLPSALCKPQFDGADVQWALDAAVRNRDQVFELPSGDIYFRNVSPLDIVGAHDLRIEGMNSTLWFEPGAGVRLNRCDGVVIRNLSIDYNPLPYTQATIIGISNVTGETATYDLELAPRSPLFNATCVVGQKCENDTIAVLWGSDGVAKAGTDYGGKMPVIPLLGPPLHFAPLGERRFRSAMPRIHSDQASAVTGDILTWSGRDWFTLVLANSSQVVAEDITIHSSTGFTIMELDGQCGHTYRRVHVVRRPGYMIASNADVFHSIDCARGATLEDSLFEVALDDFVNIHSTVHVSWSPSRFNDTFMIAPRIGNHEGYLPRPLSRNITDYWYGTSSPMSNMRKGDAVSCRPIHPGSLGNASVLHLADDPEEVLDKKLVEQAQQARDTFNSLGAGLYPWPALRLWRVKVDGPLANGLCDLVPFSGAGAVVQNNVFRHSGHPQCGLRLKASRSLVAGNRWESNLLLNLEVGYLQSWLEGPMEIRDILFANETIVDCTPDNSGKKPSFYSLPSGKNVTTRNITVLPRTRATMALLV